MHLDAPPGYLRRAILAKDRWAREADDVPEAHADAEAPRFWHDFGSQITEGIVVPYRARADSVIDVESFAGDPHFTFFHVRQ